MEFSDGVLVVDKPAGPTSHDVVAVARRALRRSTMDHRRSTMKVGHTGTLDPLASGVLPLVLGRATRLAQFLSSAEKEYAADVQLGVSTTTFDRGGERLSDPGARSVTELTLSDVEEAVSELRGSYLQQPPVFSAKKIDGDRAYDLARRHEPVPLEPSQVTAHTLEIVDWTGEHLRLRLVCSAGFYVRSLAQAIGQRLGTGAYLAGLVRTRSGAFSLDAAVTLGELDRHPERAATKVILLTQLLLELPALILTEKGASLAARGGFIAPGHVSGPQPIPTAGRVRLMHPDGHLVAIAEPLSTDSGRASGLLHPGVVLD